MFCQKCGKENTNESAFCIACGAQISSGQTHIATPNSIGQAAGALNKSQSMAAFVGNNFDYYNAKWQGKDSKKDWASWNWAAFFFSFFWLAYRKMYGMAIFSSILYLLSFIVAEVMRSKTLPFTIPLTFTILVSMYGNSWYLRRANKITDYFLATKSQESVKYELSRKGGTTFFGVLIFTIVFGFIVIALETNF